jgi:hypothetical protein
MKAFSRITTKYDYMNTRYWVSLDKVADTALVVFLERSNIGRGCAEDIKLLWRQRGLTVCSPTI